MNNEFWIAVNLVKSSTDASPRRSEACTVRAARHRVPYHRANLQLCASMGAARPTRVENTNLLASGSPGGTGQQPTGPGGSPVSAAANRVVLRRLPWHLAWCGAVRFAPVQRTTPPGLGALRDQTRVDNVQRLW